MTADEDLIAEARAVSLDYEPWDEDDKLGPKPWDPAAIKVWEEHHGHDIRLKCYPEYGCQVLEVPWQKLVVTLADKVEQLTAENAELRCQAAS